MSFQPSRPELIRTLFQGNKFIIPAYQRKYSWGPYQRKALWDDISENIELKHFIGTLSFKKIANITDVFSESYEIIDGQQRITTLYILLNVLIEKLEDETLKEGYTKLFIGSEPEPKLLSLGVDSEFLKQVIFHFGDIEYEKLVIRSQINLYRAKKDFIGYSSEFDSSMAQQWINFISAKIEILIFNVDKQSEAVKMFSVINDRGLPLSNLDKTKSLLMLYSTIYLDEKLNPLINTQFGEIFDCFDEMIYHKNKLGLFRTLDDHDFENTFYTHHYYTARRFFADWDYNLGADNIFRQLKRLCEQNKHNQEELTQTIQNYLNDFHGFAKAYSGLFACIAKDRSYQRYFLYMEFTATLYPLLVRLHQHGRLDDLLGILEVVELRVYKLKGTNPRRGMYHLASDIVEKPWTTDEIHDNLVNHITNFCNDYFSEERLGDEIDSNTALVRYTLYKKNLIENNQELTLEQFRNLQVEHIFSVNPNFDFKHHGFTRREVYDREIKKLGNLTILEKWLNKEVNNIAPSDKVEGYRKSALTINTNLTGLLETLNQPEVQRRTGILVQFFMQQFNIPTHKL